MNLPQCPKGYTCPKGCTSPFYLSTVIEYQNSDGVDEFWCASCKFCWDNPAALPPIRKSDRPSPFKKVSQRHHKNG